MENSIRFALFFILFSCSPYRKVTVSASEYMTNKMRGSTHAEVIRSLGTYNKRTDVEGGYRLDGKVQTVRAEGFPDSVRYIPRK